MRRQTWVLRLIAIVLALSSVAIGCGGATPSTKVDGQRVFQIRDLAGDCDDTGSCVARGSIVQIDDLHYQGSCAPVRPDARTGKLFAVRRGNDLQHDWIEVRVIEGFDPRLVAAARSRTKRCNLQWFVAHIVTTPTSREEAADIGKAFCNAGTVPVYRSWQKKCADGGPFEWFTDDGGDIEGRVWLKPATSATT